MNYLKLSCQRWILKMSSDPRRETATQKYLQNASFIAPIPGQVCIVLTILERQSQGRALWYQIFKSKHAGDQPALVDQPSRLRRASA